MTHELSLSQGRTKRGVPVTSSPQRSLHSQISDSTRTQGVSESTRLMAHKHRYRLHTCGKWVYWFFCICGEFQPVDKFKFRRACLGDV